MNGNNQAEHGMRTRVLREIVAERVGVRWEVFAKEHPNLAAAIERVRLIEQGVKHLERDPAYQAAMQAAEMDAAVLAAAAKLVAEVDRWVGRTLGV